MSKAGPKGGAKGGDRASRLSSALRDNLRRRKAATRPSEGGGEKPAGDGRPNATPPQKTADGGRED